MPFTKLGLSNPVLAGVKAMGYVEPTPIQLRAIPLIMAGQDVIGSAQTGTGKTAAFALPILSQLGQHSPQTRMLVLEPTRELAAQVETAIHDFARFTSLRTLVMFGGVGYGRQREGLKNGVDVIVATPGRLLDHLRQGTCRLDHVKFLVLDEADRMLDMGFLPDVRRILLLELLKRVNYESVIVFCRTKHGADRAANVLKRNNHAVAVLHSNRTQSEREQALRGFRDGRYEVLVATDIAARGLDITSVSHVVNYDVPQHPEDYIHRIGRTGRMEATGDAFTLMVAEDIRHVNAIERFISMKIPRVKLENFDYKYTALFEQGKPGRPQGGGGVRGARVRGGYFYGPARRRR